MKTKLALLFLSISLVQSLSAKIWINEFMQSNIDLVRDDLQEFPDSWIELYNDSNQGVNIQNWYVSEKPDYSQGWKINQSATVPAKGYLLVYGDNAASGLHTSFRLESGSGSIYLFDATKNAIDSVTNFSKQPAPNISKGRTADAADTWAYFVEATPNRKNEGKTSDRLLANPVFSQTGGVFKNAVQLSLSLPDNKPAEVTLSNLHYTLDNSEPTAHSPVYSTPLNISSTKVVKAKLIHPDYLTNRSQAHSYIITSRNLTLPVISISLDGSYLWDDEFGIYCQGNGKYGLAGNGIDYKANWNNNWRRPVNFEYFPAANGEAALNQLGEMRIAGGWSRANPQKTFIVYGHKRFGEKQFAYDLFSTKPNQEIKSFMIRNSGNDFWYTHFRDAAIQLLFGGKVDVDYQAYQPAIFYLNGQYWGIQNLRERSEEDFILANYATENIDMIENWWGELKAGDKTDWNTLMSKLRKSASQMNYQWIMDQVDLNEFINYMILQIYVGNMDFPNNNMVMWKPKETGGKWRFILKDTDQGLGIWWNVNDNNANNDRTPNYNTLAYNANGTDDPRRLFKALLTQSSFKKDFYSRFAIYMGDILQYNTIAQVIDSIQPIVATEMPNHIDRWKPEVGWGDLDFWKDQVTQMKTWSSKRNTNVYTHLKNYFSLGTVMKMTLETAGNLKGTPVVSINGVQLQKPQLDGSYFQKETVNLRFEGDHPGLYDWEITATVNGITTTTTYFQRDVAYAIADKCSSLKIKIVDNPTDIPAVDRSKIVLTKVAGQLLVTGLEGGSQVSVYDAGGRLVNKLHTNDYSVTIPVAQKGVLIVKVNSPTQVFNGKIIL
ncbi:MAG: CotH kinase family protein [Candidatus Symbiothrix sp.]|jgi:hypothetical protein|nr:CotH kinase family protein [Candidatus Symbiothrix sp.]